jgi:flagellar motor component MotA
VLRIVLFLSSLANIAAGVGLGALWFDFRHDPGMQIIVMGVALSLLVQGGFTLGHLRGLWKQWGLPSFSLFVAGESAAALVGAVAILQGVIYNLHPINGDYEFGPLMAATLMTTQATIGLIFAVRSGELSVRKNA